MKNDSVKPDIKESDEVSSIENKEMTGFDLRRADLVSSVVIFCFGLFVVLSGIDISFFKVNGTNVWYYSPGIFPILIGAVLMSLSAMMFFSKYRSGARIRIKDLSRFKDAVKNPTLLRLVIAIALLAIYVFVTFPRLPFLLSTFLYLAVTMTVFRKYNYPIWKIIVISAVTTGIIYLFFGVIAAIPLP